MTLGELVEFVAATARLNGVDPMSVEVRGVKEYSLCMSRRPWVLQIGPDEDAQRIRRLARERLCVEAQQFIERLRDEP